MFFIFMSPLVSRMGKAPSILSSSLLSFQFLAMAADGMVSNSSSVIGSLYISGGSPIGSSSSLSLEKKEG